MKYFNGFSLLNEESFFSEYIENSDFCVAGFSYGAQKAFDYVYNSKTRVDRLILLSPAFFQTEKTTFIRTQLRYFKADKDTYIKQFLKNTIYPSSFDLSDNLNIGTEEELKELLTYEWNKYKIQTLLDRGITIEVFLGEKDKIIDSKSAFNFFKSLTTTYLIKDAGHLLKSSLKNYK